MSEWQELKLGEVLNLKRGYDLTRRERIDGSIPVYSSSGISGFHNEAKANAPGVVTGRYGTIGKIFLAKTPFWPHNTTLYVEDFRGNDEIFIYYFLQQLNWEQFNDKSAVPGINRNDAHQANVTIPPLPEQRAIADVLSALDDKIDLLHRQNRTLESLAQTLFRHWFIDGAGEEWEVGTLGDLIELHYGKGLKSTLRTGEGFPVVGSSGVVDYHSEFLVEAPGIVIGRKGTLGEVIYLSENFFPIDTTYFVKSKNDSPDLYFEYCLLKTIDFKEMNTDSAVPGLNRTIALGTEVAHPLQTDITQFNELVHPLFQKTIANHSQIDTLAALRDTLLPKLMSGEVRVRGEGVY